MLPKHHLPQLTLGRVQSAIRRLQQRIWENPTPVRVEASIARPEHCSLSEAKNLSLSLQAHNTYWGKLFDQRWCRIEFPEPVKANTWLHWQDQGEATLYVGDQAYWGFNVAHDRCLLPQDTKEVWIQSTCCQSAIWHAGARGMERSGAHFKEASVSQRNDHVWHAFHDLECLFDLAMELRSLEAPHIPKRIVAEGQQPPVESHSPTFRYLLRWMNESVTEWEKNGIPAMREHLAKAYQALKTDAAFSHCLLTGHAHVDLVWLWPERVGELKAVNVFSTMNRLMEAYPEFRFAYSQPASYEAVKRREPGLYKSVQTRIQSGAWQATGALYVESDTQIACGEALARGFEVGQKWFKDTNGHPSSLCWLPDAFGFSACLPQIMKQHGVEYFFTTKTMWNAINRFPHSSFTWRGQDGSEVLANVMQDCGYVTHMEVDRIQNAMNGNMQADIHDEFLMPTGYGDGGGGTTASMLERARRLDGLPGMPSMRWGHPEKFFENLKQDADKYPVHQGECYLEYHRGTFTTHGNLKAIFRGLERALQIREAVAVATDSLCDIEAVWKRIIFAQFHDYIPGSSVWDVYKEGLPELQQLTEEQIHEAVEQLSLTHADTNCLFNPHAVPVPVWHSNAQEPPQYLELPALQGVAINDAVFETPPAVKINDRTFSHDRASFRVNAEGWIEELIWDGLQVPITDPLGQLVLYLDQPANFDSWDIDRHSLSMGEVCAAEPSIDIWSDGPHRAGCTITRAIGKNSTSSVKMFLESGSPLVHLQVDLDWQEKDTLLKLRIPTDYRAAMARFGSPFGSVLRPQLPSGRHTDGMWEVPFSRYLSVFDEGEREGLFVVTEAKYGASVHSGEVGISLVRSPKVTGFDALGGAWPAHLSRLKGVSAHSDQGAHNILLALGKYSLDLPREAHPASLADTLFTPPQPYRGNPTRSLLKGFEGGVSLIPCWARPLSKDSWVLRLHEVSGQRGLARIRGVKGWNLRLINMDGSLAAGSLQDGQIPFSAYQILTVRFDRIPLGD